MLGFILDPIFHGGIVIIAYWLRSRPVFMGAATVYGIVMGLLLVALARSGGLRLAASADVRAVLVGIATALLLVEVWHRIFKAMRGPAEVPSPDVPPVG